MSRLLRPAWLVLVPVIVSFVIWIIDWPPGFRTGFTDKEPITVPGVLLLVVWYGSIALAATFGLRFGLRSKPVQRLADSRDDRVYWILTAAAFLGVAYTYVGAELTAPGVLLASIQDSQFNDVRSLVPYAAGVPTLRYASTLAGGMALYQMTMFRSLKPIHLLNLVLLALSAALNSRLSLILAVFVFLVLTATARSRGVDTRRRLSGGTFVSIGLGLFILLAALNYIRNANFYEVNFDTTNPVSMNVQELVTYADSPMQVSIGVATKGTDDLPRAADITPALQQFLAPSFTQTKSSGTSSNSDWFRGLIPLENNLTTNSALVELYGDFGLYAIPIAVIVAFVAGAAMGHCSRYRNAMIIVAAVIGYCFLEVWRIFLFNTGLIIFCILAVVMSCLVSGRRPDDDTAGTTPAGVGAGAA